MPASGRSDARQSRRPPVCRRFAYNRLLCDGDRRRKMSMESPRDVLVEALKDVEEANVPEDLREIAFAKAFDLRAGTARVSQPSGAGGEVGGSAVVPATRGQLDAG